MRLLAIGALLAGLATAAACSRRDSDGPGKDDGKPAGNDGGASPRSRPPSPFEAFSEAAPRVGEQAPAFALADLDGDVVELAGAVARGPVVLIFGSFS